ncbi:MAG: hypothetical protein AAF602_20375, partial [Myxococcota bacterium]
KFAYSALNVETRQTVHSDYGIDGNWNTQDDTIAFYIEFDFDDRGFWRSFTLHDDPGPGLIWFDDDDPLVQRGIYAPPRDPSPPMMAARLGDAPGRRAVRPGPSFGRDAPLTLDRRGRAEDGPLVGGHRGR